MTTASAGPVDAFGESAMTSGRAGGVVADVEPADAPLLNPARLSSVKNIDALIDLNIVDDKFRIQDEDAELDTFISYRLSFAARVPLGSLKDRLFLGATAMLPQGKLYSIENPVSATPRILMKDASVRHFDLAASAAVRIWRTLAIGAGFTLAPQASGSVEINFANQHAHHTTVEVGCEFAPIVGLTYAPVEHLSLGFAWRGAVRTEYVIPASVVVSEQIGEIRTRVRGINFGEPDRFTLGASYDFSWLAPTPLARFKARVEFGYEHYRDDISSIPYVELLDPNDDVLVETPQVPLQFEDSWHIAASLDWMPLDVLQFAVGYAWQSSPVPAQRNILNMLDAAHSRASLGITAWLPERWLSSPRQVGLSTSGSVEIYQRREMEKYEILAGYPGYPAITFDGFDFSWHLSLILNF